MPDILKKSAVALGCALIVFWIASPVILQHGWYYNHDTWCAYRMEEFALAFKDGALYPRWMSRMLGGYGYPNFIYYQPGYFYLTLPFTYLTDVISACKISIFVILYAGMTGAYCFARLWYPRWLSFCFAVIFIFSRYVVTNLDIRGDLTEFTAMLIAPWNMYFLFRLVAGMRERTSPGLQAAGFSFTALLIAISHPFFAALWFPFAAGLLFFLTIPKTRDWSIFAAGMLCFAIAVVLSAPYWYTVVQMKDLVHLERPLYSFQAFMESFNSAFHLLDHSNQSIYFVQEYWYFFAAIAGFALFIRQGWVAFAFAFYMLYSLMMTDYAIPYWQAGFDYLRYLQFDWRLLAPVVTIRYIGIVQLGKPLMQLYGKSREGRLLAVMIAVTTTGLVIFAEKDLFYLDPTVAAEDKLYKLDYYTVVPQIVRKDLVYANGVNEFLPKTADFDALTNRYSGNIPAALLPDNDGTISDLTDDAKGEIHLRLTIQKDANLRINQLYFPGWKVAVDGQEQPLVATTEGLISVTVKAAGAHVVRAWYDGPPGWQTRNIVILVLFIVLLVLLGKTLMLPIHVVQKEAENPAPDKNLPRIRNVRR